MRRMYSENQLIELIQKYGGDIEKIKEELVGSYVRIMDAPTSRNLTSEQINAIKEGVFFNGTIEYPYINLINPIFLPSISIGSDLHGVVIATNTVYRQTIFYYYSIATANNNYLTISESGFHWNEYGKLTLNNIMYINGKAIPDYPSNTGSFTLKCVDGVLTWVADAE